MVLKKFSPAGNIYIYIYTNPYPKHLLLFICCHQASGPLFGDIDVIEFKYREYLWSKGASKFTEIKCSICGFPNCPCQVCKFKSARLFQKNKSKQSGEHTCKLAGARKGAPPKKGWHTQEVEDLRYNAWEAVGSDSIPDFVKGPGWSGYFFPQEIQDSDC